MAAAERDEFEVVELFCKRVCVCVCACVWCVCVCVQGKGWRKITFLVELHSVIFGVKGLIVVGRCVSVRVQA